MTTMKVDVSCCLCEQSYTAEFTAPDGWADRLGGVDVETTSFCPRHAAVVAFTKSQCVGCVGGWGQCDMWRAFAFSGERNLRKEELDYLRERGQCPRRTNGTLLLSVPHHGEPVLREEDLSETDLAGARAFADAIVEYWAKYYAGER